MISFTQHSKINKTIEMKNRLVVASCQEWEQMDRCGYKWLKIDIPINSDQVAGWWGHLDLDLEERRSA